MPTIIMSKPASKLEASVKKKAYAFLEKLSADDTAPGLHIEPITNSADNKVRTGRVDQFYRAVLFRVPGTASRPTCSRHLAARDAIAVAKKTRLEVNPVNGITEIITVPDRRRPASGSPAPRPGPSGPRPAGRPPARRAAVAGRPGPGPPDPDRRLGIDGTLADRALAAADENALLALAAARSNGRPWR